MTPGDLVIGFITALGVCLRALRGTTSEVSRAEVRAPLTAVGSTGSRSREGSIDGVGKYQLHGIGCRFELESGEEVDFDWDPDGRPTFDVWRVRAYARSVGHDSVTADQLAEALASLCDDGVLSEAAGDGFHIRDGQNEPPGRAER
jgi:hypothetical protein